MGQIEWFPRAGDAPTDALTVADLWALHEAMGNYDECDRITSALAALPPDADEHMGLSVVTKLRKPFKPTFKPKRKRRGLKGLGPRPRKRVRSAAKIMGQMYGPRNLVFLTLTLPNFTDDELLTICQQWPYLVRRVREEVCRELERHGHSSEFLWVAEIQMGRFWKSGQVCPHLHALFCNKVPGAKGWILTPEFIDQLWARLLSGVLDRPVDCSTACQIDRVKKGVAQEMAKYLSKGAGDMQAILEAGMARFLPSTYSGMTRNLSREIDRQTRIERGRSVELMFDNLETLQKIGVLRFRKVYVTLESSDGGPSRDVCVGATGFFRCEDWQQLLCETKVEMVAAAWQIAAAHRRSVSVDRQYSTA